MSTANQKLFASLSTSASPAAAASSDDRPQAMLWLNIGREVTIKDENGDTIERFVSIPVGIPLDTMKELKVSGTNQMYNYFTQARNDLLNHLVAAGSELDPGEEAIVDLQCQLRRVGEPQAAIPTSENPFAIMVKSVK